MKFLKLIIIGLIAFLFLSCNKTPEKKNVIFILIDTLRADHLSMNGYERITTPNLDAFSKESIFFKNTFSPAPWTPVAMASIFTGLYPSAHGMLPPISKDEALKKSYKLSQKNYTLSELYRDNGFYTMAVQTNPWLNEFFGYTQGFDKFVYKHKGRAGRVNDEAILLINEYKKSKNKAPFYLYLHYFDPHKPYKAPPKYDELYNEDIKAGKYDASTQDLIRKYDREIKFTDDKLGELFSYLKENDLYDNSIIVILADHGEQFYEHGALGHGNFLYNEEIKVPFLIKTDGKGKEINTRVSSLDLFETLVSLSNLKNDKSQAQGFSLVTKEGLDKRKRTNVFSEIKSKENIIQKSLVNNSLHKIIFDFDINSKEEDIKNLKIKEDRIYDLKKDSLEQTPIQDEKLKENFHQNFKSFYHKILQGKIKTDENDKVKMDDKTMRELKSLGYL